MVSTVFLMRASLFDGGEVNVQGIRERPWLERTDWEQHSGVKLITLTTPKKWASGANGFTFAPSQAAFLQSGHLTGHLTIPVPA